MKEAQCPICYAHLIPIDCTPCYDCGHLEHTPGAVKTTEFKIYEIYNSLRLTLCNFCAIDFGSYKPGYFGEKNLTRIGYEKLTFVKDIKNPCLEKDKHCPECNKRLKFLKFLIELRLLIEKRNE